MTQGLFVWSKTAASNGNADTSINFSEGQSPSSVNDSARALMARVAEYRDDRAGALTTGGTSTAYTVSSNQSFDTLAHLDGQSLRIRFNATNGASPTLNIDSLGAKAIRVDTTNAVSKGVIRANSIWDVVYDNSNSCFILVGGSGVKPPGFVEAYAGSTVPAGYLLCDGSAVSRTTYADLFAIISTTYGSGDGSTTFNVPDIRGRVVVGKDDMGGTAASRVTSAASGLDGATLGASGGAQTNTLTAAQLPAHKHAAFIQDPGHFHTLPSVGTNAFSAGAISAAITTSGGAGRPVDASTTGVRVKDASGNLDTTDSVGSGQAIGNVQPSIVLNFIIKT